MNTNENLSVYAVFECDYGTTHKRLVCLFTTEKAAKSYAASLDDFEAGISSPYMYKVEQLVVSAC